MRFLPRALLLLGVAFALAPAGGVAQTPFEGTFALDAAASDDVNAAIDQAVRPLNFAIRPIARGRLRKTNQPYQTVRISNSGGQIVVATDTRAPIQAAAGTPIRWTREDGEVFDVAMAWKDGGLEQSFSAEDGERVNHFSLGPDGDTLHLQVTVTSPRLREPVRYRLVYRRAG